MQMAYIKIFVDCLVSIEPLDDAERGRLFTALLEYAKDGKIPVLEGNERFLFPTLRAQLDRDAAAYESLCEQNSRKGSMGGRPSKKAAAFSESQKSQEEEKEEDKEKDKDKEKDSSSAAFRRGGRSAPGEKNFPPKGGKGPRKASGGTSAAPESYAADRRRMERLLQEMYAELEEQARQERPVEPDPMSFYPEEYRH